MPLRRIKKHFDKQAEAKSQLERVGEELLAIRQKYDYLVLVPKPTGMNWVGVSNATKRLFGDAVLEVPQYYSQPLFNEKQNQQFVKLISAAKFKQVICSGHHLYFLDLLATLKLLGIKTGVIFHGALSELAESPERLSVFARMMEMLRTSQIDKIGFVKKGLAETFQELATPNSFNLFLNCPIPEGVVSSNGTLEKPRIAIAGGGNFNKNLHNQVAAALLVKDSEIHLWGNSKDFEFWNSKDRIVTHPHSSHSDFLKALGSCDASLYLSFSESWGQVITESLAMGIPCLCSDNNGIFDDNEELKQLLVVSSNDNPALIAERLKFVLSKKEELKPKLIAHIDFLNQKAEELKTVFLIA